MANFLTRLFGSRNQRMIRDYGKVVKKISAMEEGLQALDDDALRAKTDEFRRRHQDGESLHDLLPEAFAVAREASQRTLSLSARPPLKGESLSAKISVEKAICSIFNA